MLDKKIEPAEESERTLPLDLAFAPYSFFSSLLDPSHRKRRGETALVFVLTHFPSPLAKPQRLKML
jgi:hypothetical protein